MVVSKFGISFSRGPLFSGAFAVSFREGNEKHNIHNRVGHLTPMPTTALEVQKNVPKKGKITMGLKAPPQHFRIFTEGANFQKVKYIEEGRAVLWRKNCQLGEFNEAFFFHLSHVGKNGTIFSAHPEYPPEV